MPGGVLRGCDVITGKMRWVFDSGNDEPNAQLQPGLLAKAGRVEERLRGIADDVCSYAAGQRAAERSGHALESAGGALERATESFETVVQRHELTAERGRVEQAQRQKDLVKEREFPGPSLEL